MLTHLRRRTRLRSKVGGVGAWPVQGGRGTHETLDFEPYTNRLHSPGSLHCTCMYSYTCITVKPVSKPRTASPIAIGFTVTWAVSSLQRVSVGRIPMRLAFVGFVSTAAMTRMLWGRIVNALTSPPDPCCCCCWCAAVIPSRLRVPVVLRFHVGFRRCRWMSILVCGMMVAFARGTHRRSD